MKLSTPVSAAPQPNLQIIPYQQKPSLTAESLNSLYSMNSVNQYYSQNPYFHGGQTANTPRDTSGYPAIGFSHFVQQPNYPNYGYSNYYQSSSSIQSHNWSSAPTISTPTTTIATPTQSAEFTLAPISAPKPMPSTSLERPTPPPSTSLERPTVKSSVNSGDNLIDFDVDDSKYATNILQHFDPLITANRNSAEDAENDYYIDQDPFDYIYSGGTQYSDPLYDAVVRSDHSLTSPKSQTPQEISEYYAAAPTKPTKPDETNPETTNPPPLPPRNSNRSDAYETNGTTVVQYSKKLYENVTHQKLFDRELVEFYNMVKSLRSKYVFDHDESNVGHIIAAELDSSDIKVSSIKILVYPSLECFQGRNYVEPFSERNQENYQKLEGYANPIVFTCDITSNIAHVINHVLVDLEGKVTGNAEDFALKTIGSQEWLLPTSSLSRLEYIQLNITLEKDVQLGLFPKDNKYIKVLARTRQDDVRDADIKFENILPKELVSSISYDTLMILLETLEQEIDKLESSAADTLSLHPSGVVQAVKAICAILGSIDTLELFMAINNLKEACRNHSQSFTVRVSVGMNHY